MTLQLVELAIAITALVAIGVGVWWHDPGLSLVVVGVIVLACTCIPKLRRPRRD